MRNSEAETQAITFKRPKQTLSGEVGAEAGRAEAWQGVLCTAIFITPHFHRRFVLPSLSSLGPSVLDLSFSSHFHLYVADKASIPLADNTIDSRPDIKKRLCLGLAEGRQMVSISLQNRPGKPENKNGNSP